MSLEQALSRRAASGTAGTTSRRVVAAGAGWEVSDVLCTCSPQDRPFEEQHSLFSIAIVLEGTFRYRSEGRQGVSNELMTPGSLFLGNPGQCFECGHEHGKGDRCLSFQFEPEYFERLLADEGVAGAGFPVLRLPSQRQLSPVVTKACARLTAADGEAVAVWEELGIQLATQVAQVAIGSSRATRAASPSAIRGVARAARWIERHSDSELRLGELAREAGLSPYHFLRTFEQITGVTPHRYVRRIRLRKAALRLSTEPAKVLDIALDCGFGDVSNFNRAFREEFGVSPRSYRCPSRDESSRRKSRDARAGGGAHPHMV